MLTMKEVKMPAELKIKEESPTRIIVETDPLGRASSEYLRLLLLPVPFLAGVLIVKYFPTWPDWIIVAVAILVEIVVILIVYVELVNVTLLIDANSQHATLIEKFFFIRTRTIRLDFNQINRVLIRREESGQHYSVFLDSSSRTHLLMALNLPAEEKQRESMLLSKKIGMLMKKPVVMQVTEVGIVISENRI